MSTVAARRFPSPFETPAPPGAEGWESMYPPYILFSEENREWEESLFWFYDSLHRPEVEVPFDTIVHEAWFMAASANLSREFAVPAANGYASRILNGRLYTTPLPVTEDVIQERVPVYVRRAGYYFEHWDELYEKWTAKLAAGADILLFRPDDEVKKLARKGLELGLADRLRADGRPDAIVEELRHEAAGSQWVAALDAAKDPWFHYSTGTGLYHHERSW